VLQTFRSEIVKKHVTKIEALVLDSLRQLLRKQSLVSELHIDPEQFAVELRNGDGKVLGANRLSAGERQLLAVSLLWGLARVSGRPLPVVTDTPLGRLDATHRSHLVERYFPQASHQMLLLSTDEEIDRGYYDKLKSSISHSYHLHFDEKSKSTQIHQGYFW
jgi:DNA sulfur modification protein DndD